MTTDTRNAGLDDNRTFALDAAEHIIGMVRGGEDENNCLSEGADVILEAFEKIAALPAPNTGEPQQDWEWADHALNKSAPPAPCHGPEAVMCPVCGFGKWEVD